MKTIIIGTLAIACLFGCSSETEPSTTTPTTAPTVAPGAPSVDASAIRSRFPALAGWTDAKVQQAVANMCQEIASGKDDTTIINNATQRFEVNAATATQLVEIVRTGC
ncbi:hypothetical protein [Frankia sp. AgB32]|uniref:hypothetical protein n=1 Tax=Frankia sp. AgB32 TaxID=631119 RepID=UPI00200D7A79|nr:hypothetical protein [Frankia sp. AgB32]MCK9898441.1 hypothetical protein [Frankia sp. AgB32]